MRKIDLLTYRDKVYGCYLGKCIAGTIGAPFEGMKEKLDVTFEPRMIERMLPNDDLDLQVLWLEVLEHTGVNFTSDDLADAFLVKCPYSCGEYAVFKKNYRRGIHPPVSGAYNNRYYREGMGCPIRSEIWACVAPGDPPLAARLAAMDGTLDHEGNSVVAEQFLAAMEAEAFFESDVEALIRCGLSHIPAETRIARLIQDSAAWCKQLGSWEGVRSRIIQRYGHPDCTNLFQNMGFIVLALLLGKGDFLQTTMLALNCGFDTDCTCGTAGALLGVVLGAQDMFSTCSFTEQTYVLGVDVKRPSYRISDLADDIGRVGIDFVRRLSDVTEIGDAREVPPDPVTQEPRLSFCVEYEGMPVIGVGDTKRARIILRNDSSNDVAGVLEIRAPASWVGHEAQRQLTVPAHKTTEAEIAVRVPNDVQVLEDTNLIDAVLHTPGRDHTYRFGIAGASVWSLYGPFWENTIAIGTPKPGESYMSRFTGDDKDKLIDSLREYHLSMVADMGRRYISLSELSSTGVVSGAATGQRLRVNVYEDRFSIGELVGFEGPCVIYMVREMISPEDREVSILIGHSDAFEVWINGLRVAHGSDIHWWTPENLHVSSFHIRKGVNRIALKLCRRTQEAVFSIVLTHREGGSLGLLSFPEHITDFASGVPRPESLPL